jgi:hypothetical protein
VADGAEGGWGPPYFVVQRLVNTLDYHWTAFNGWAVSQGLDLIELPLDALLDLTYYWLIKDATEEDVKMLDSQLWMPPTKAKKTPAPKNSPWSDEATLASFSAFMNSAGAVGGGS